MDIDTAQLGRLAAAFGKAALPGLETAVQAGIGLVGGPIIGGVANLALPGLFALVNSKLGLDADAPPDQTAAKIEDNPVAAQAALATLDAQQQFALAQQKQADDTRIDSQAQQTALVALDSASKTFWQYGWRPAAAWVCVAALAVDAVMIPQAGWVAATFYGKALPPPPDIATLVGLLSALLGLGLMRTADKVTTASAVKAIAAAPVRR